MKVHRCIGAYRLVPQWWETDAYLEAESGIPAECYQCPPCRRRPGSQWLATAGHNAAIVTAGCEQAAKEAMHVRIYGRGRRHQMPSEVERITARPASAEDVARFEQILTEQREAG